MVKLVTLIVRRQGRVLFKQKYIPRKEIGRERDKTCDWVIMRNESMVRHNSLINAPKHLHRT